MRGLTRVPADRNAKGIALFALAALGDYRRRRTEESEIQARVLLDALLSMKLDGYSGAAWGYNFDWQSRNFFAAQRNGDDCADGVCGASVDRRRTGFTDSQIYKMRREVFASLY